MKKNIKFECDVCGQKQVVEVSVLHSGGTLQIMIDRFFIMDVDFRNGKWVMLCNNTSWLTTDELVIILDELGYEE
ncbi:hypothetical protein [Sphingobacterium sp. GVS05A]|uniref:hypothetical protein n=1 Tax=Sphingobacterium sp. GVS05A TaxID=2862679 RepID=UPI001CBC36E2|nr:hypothetical protein [Sphingobacterium sp. GVS05A]